MLSYAVGVVKNCVRLIVRENGKIGVEECQRIFLTSCLYEILLVKLVQLITVQTTEKTLLLLLLLEMPFEMGAICFRLSWGAYSAIDCH